jgi:hypothetical protein
MVDQAASLHEQQQEQAWETYRALLEPGRMPEEGDEQRLMEAMQVLGIDAQQMRKDADALKQVRQYERRLESRQDIASRKAQAEHELAQYDAETERIRQEREKGRQPLQQQVDAALREHQSLSGLDTEIADIMHRDEHTRRLFGLPLSNPEESNRRTLNTGPTDQRQEI